MKKIIKYTAWLAIVTCLVADVNAVTSGFYMGIMTGPSSNSAPKAQSITQSGTPPTVTVTPKSMQWGTRVFMGDKFNNYAGVEGGATYYSSINYNAKPNVPTCVSCNTRVRDFDIVARGDLPFAYGFSAFGKGGVAVTYITTSGGLNAPSSGKTCGQTQRQIKYRPTITLGVSYDITQSWVTDLSYGTLMAGGQAGNINFLALGISYHFVDRYCGQFLCDD